MTKWQAEGTCDSFFSTASSGCIEAAVWFLAGEAPTRLTFSQCPFQSAVRAHCRTAQYSICCARTLPHCTTASDQTLCWALLHPGYVGRSWYKERKCPKRRKSNRERWKILKSISGRQNRNNYSDTETRPCLDCWCMYLLCVLFKFRPLYLPTAVFSFRNGITFFYFFMLPSHIWARFTFWGWLHQY